MSALSSSRLPRPLQCAGPQLLLHTWETALTLLCGPVLGPGLVLPPSRDSSSPVRYDQVTWSSPIPSQNSHLPLSPQCRGSQQINWVGLQDSGPESSSSSPCALCTGWIGGGVRGWIGGTHQGKRVTLNPSYCGLWPGWGGPPCQGQGQSTPTGSRVPFSQGDSGAKEARFCPLPFEPQEPRADERRSFPTSSGAGL